MIHLDENQSASIDQFLERLEKLHSSPVVALRVMELTRDHDFDMAEVADCLKLDPALAALILRLVNSSYYGLSQGVTSLQHALAYLGRRTLRVTVLSFGLVKSMVRGAPAEFHDLYWKRSLTMAAAAQKVTLMAGKSKIDADTAFAGGLLADLGMLVIGQLETEKYIELPLESDHILELVQRERKMFGFDHMGVCQRLLDKWQMPMELIEAVANHHTYLPSSRPLNQVLLAANLLSEVLWLPASPYMQPLQLVLANQFGLSIDDLITLAVESKESVQNSMEIFDVRLDGTIDLEEIEKEVRHQYEIAVLDTAADLDSMESLLGAELCIE